MSDNEVEKNVSDEYRKKINQRKGHRSYVTRIYKKVRDALDSFTEDTRDELEGWKSILIDQLKTLQKLFILKW